MIFTVVYLRTASNELTNLWIAASDRQAVTDASDEIDRRLRRDGHQAGQPFFGQRVLAVPPLAVTFEVSLDDRMVTVIQVQRID